MNKTFKIYAILFVIVLAVLTMLEFSKNDVTDWRKNYDVNKKSPFGLYVFDQEFASLLNNNIERSDLSPFNYYGYDSAIAKHNILLIQKSIDTYSWNKILNQVSKGSTALIISEDIPKNIQDTLRFKEMQISFEETQSLQFTDIKFKQDSLRIDKFPSEIGFKYIDKNHQILGKTVEKSNYDQANFIKINFGEGHFYIHTEPLFLTNYYLLKNNNYQYLENVFSYLPNQKTVWFTQNSSVAVSASPLRFILANDALRYAWWLLLASLLLFTIFNIKRKQRIVPVIEPLKNKSVEFIKSIGNLYLQEGDFHDMMAKKTQYFLSKVRMDLLLDTQHLDDNFAKKLQLKTGKPIEKIQEAIALIKKAQDPYAQVMKDDLIKMNQILNEILK